MGTIAVGCGAAASSFQIRLGTRDRRPDVVVFSLLIAAAIAAVTATILFGGLWQLHAVDPSLRSALETGVSLCAVLSSVLLLANFRQTQLLRDLLLLAGMATAGLTSFVFNTLPEYGSKTSVYGAGARSALTVLVAGLFVAVAFVPERRVEAGRRLAAKSVGAAVSWVALGEAVDLLAGPVHPVGPAGDFRGISIMVMLVSFIWLVASVYGFLGRSGGDRVTARLLATAASLLALAQIGRLTLAVLPQDWLTPSDGLRTGTYLVLLVVSLRLYRRAQTQRAREVLSGERQRIARDLHDGLAQDLAFIAAHSDRLAHEYGSDHPLAIAAQRALAISRAQIVDLEGSRASDTPGALREVAEELARRFGVDIRVVIEGGPRGSERASDRAELVRIAREAIVNAIRHGGAQTVTVTLGAQGAELLLRVSDDGCGLAAASPETAGTGLGMQTMRERAGKLDARLTAHRSESGHTELEVRTQAGGGRRVNWRRR